MNYEKYHEYLATRHWQGIRTKTLKLSRGRCQRCGELADDCHHVTYRSIGHEVPGVDVVALCRDCHEFLSGRSTYDPAAKPPETEEPTREPPPCVGCGCDAEDLTEEEEPICKDCLWKRHAPD